MKGCPLQSSCSAALTAITAGSRPPRRRATKVPSGRNVDSYGTASVTPGASLVAWSASVAHSVDFSSRCAVRPEEQTWPRRGHSRSWEEVLWRLNFAVEDRSGEGETKK